MDTLLPEVYRFDTLDSTNTKALQLGADGARHGSCVVAANQTGGRGRLGKQWHSSSGMGLYCSYIVRPEIEPCDYPKITILAGLAVAQYLDEISGVNCLLKWPNDIFINGRKCAGILTESAGLSAPPEERFAVIGVGINCNHRLEDFPVELKDTVTSLYLASSKQMKPFSLVNGIRDRIVALLDEFCRNGFKNILQEWQQRDYLAGKLMCCVATSGKIVEGVAQGINANGELLVVDANGENHSVLTSDISVAGERE